jgi:predicted  nucleic acid-binding Zn-ribbon protein
MNKHLADLIELSKVDNEIDSFDSKEEKVKSTLNTIVEEKEQIEAQIEEVTEAIKEEKVKKNRNDIHLQELNDKLASIAKKGKEIKTEKEMKALSLEEEIAKEQVNFANEEIERLEKSVEVKEQNLEELKASLTEKSSAEETELKNVQSSLEALEDEKKSAYKTKDAVIGKMDHKIITFYEKIKRWAKNTTVVEVKKQACYGCFMKLNDRTYAEVIRSEEIVSCPHCGRILYHNPESQEAEKSEA